ncbi:hypothetical protein OnM2_020031 [Erysiphe neolycopersici]|uniref:Uncharacterized protein n=1 Tax=Erysiphe neolycopersici TaxID=212602 RepID=A0A420I3M7_9PEZI|nr:hypothetical protein OnM2_020031 [Erysiphe neolycopersici]
MTKTLRSLLFGKSNLRESTLDTSYGSRSLIIDPSLSLISTTRKSIETLLFRKITKGFEDRESNLADKDHRIHPFEVQSEKARPRNLGK